MYRDQNRKPCDNRKLSFAQIKHTGGNYYGSYQSRYERTSRRSSNNGEDNIITNGSGIAVADGQCMLIVEQGRVVEVCAEPGEFTFDASTEPSVFTGNFGDSLAATFQTVAKRFTYGGDTGKDQRVYYINTKELGEIL